jgi:hypothetical protein
MARTFAVSAAVLLLISVFSINSSVAGNASGPDELVERYFQGIVDADTGAVTELEYSYLKAGDMTGEDGRRPHLWIDNITGFSVAEKVIVNKNITAYKMVVTNGGVELQNELSLCYFVVMEDGQYYITESPYIIPSALAGNVDLLKYVREFNSKGVEISQYVGANAH